MMTNYKTCFLMHWSDIYPFVLTTTLSVSMQSNPVQHYKQILQ